jgi:hypothetical protein
MTQALDRRIVARLAPALAAVALGAWPGAAPAAFNCEQSVSYQASWCTSSQITSVPRPDAAAICSTFEERLGAACRADWDRFSTCAAFARRFEDLLVRACLDRKVGRKPCRDWGEAFAAGPLTRCKRGRTTF